MLEVAIADSSAVAQARREAVAVGISAGLDADAKARLALVATELGTNLVKHAERGRLLIDQTDKRVALLAIDSGPGMADVSVSMADGYSTAGTPGNGLGASRRAAQALEVASWPRRGTVIYARIDAADAPALRDDFCAVAVCKLGERVSGDAWCSHQEQATQTYFMVDGLGHGSEAALAATAAVQAFMQAPQQPVEDIVRSVHAAIRHTRGGAIAIARLDAVKRSVAYVGLGNIAGTVVSPDGRMRRMVSLSGTAGHNARKVQSFDYPCDAGLVVLHSDGVSGRWTMEPYPGLAVAHPMLVAGVLYRDFGRNHDDATVMVARMALQ